MIFKAGDFSHSSVKYCYHILVIILLVWIIDRILSLNSIFVTLNKSFGTFSNSYVWRLSQRLVILQRYLTALKRTTSPLQAGEAKAVTETPRFEVIACRLQTYYSLREGLGFKETEGSLHAYMAMSDSQRNPEKLCLFKYEFYINVYKIENWLFFLLLQKWLEQENL